MRATRISFAVVVALAAMAIAAATASAWGGSGSDKVTICHRTGSYSNPYVQITVDRNAVDGVAGNSGHQADHFGEHQGPVFSPSLPKHTEWGDIIPPVPPFHGGLNWSAEGQAIYNNGCKPPAPPVVTPPPPVVTPPPPPPPPPTIVQVPVPGPTVIVQVPVPGPTTTIPGPTVTKIVKKSRRVIITRHVIVTRCPFGTKPLRWLVVKKVKRRVVVHGNVTTTYVRTTVYRTCVPRPKKHVFVPVTG